MLSAKTNKVEPCVQNCIKLFFDLFSLSNWNCVHLTCIIIIISIGESGLFFCVLWSFYWDGKFFLLKSFVQTVLMDVWREIKLKVPSSHVSNRTYIGLCIWLFNGRFVKYGFGWDARVRFQGLATGFNKKN